jgi:type VI secretion system protein ImpH
MAAPRRQHRPDLRRQPPLDALLARPHRHAFFQAVRLLEWAAWWQRKDPRAEARLPIGEDNDPRAEALRLRSTIQLKFPASEVQAIDAPPGERPALTVDFFGLTGTLGALPEVYSDLVQRGLRQKQSALRDFLDLFNNRLLALFYRAWAKYRLPVSYERSRGAGREDPTTSLLYALIGLGTNGLRNRSSVPDELAVHHAGALARRARPAVVVEDLLSGALGRPVRIEQFRGEWCILPTDAQTILPGPSRPQGQFARLGVDAVAGERAWEVQGGFRIHIGPLTYDEFVDLFPGTKGATLLSDLVRLGAGPEFAFDYRLGLAAGQVPAWSLRPEPQRLGWNTWLAGTPSEAEMGVVFRPDGGGGAAEGLAA